MRLIKPHLGDSPKTNKRPSFVEPFKIIFFIVILVAVAYGGYLTYKHFHNNSESSLGHSGYSTTSQFEKASKNVNDQYLKSKDYTSYINAQILLASHYTAVNDYKNAERVMNQVFVNVPADKVTSSAFNEMVAIEQSLGNQSEYKKYLNLLINKYKATGDTKDAQVAQKILDSGQ